MNISVSDGKQNIQDIISIAASDENGTPGVIISSLADQDFLVESNSINILGTDSIGDPVLASTCTLDPISSDSFSNVSYDESTNIYTIEIVI